MMSADLLDRLLRGALPDPDGPGMLAVATSHVVINAGLIDRADQLVAKLDLGPRPAVVTDRIVRHVAGARVAQALRRAGDIIEIVIDEDAPHADDRTAAFVREASAAATGLIAVGAGTINDLCKYAGHLDAKPYAVFGTAPSMNGYVSPNAAITMAGHKQTLSATAPRGAFLDLDVLARAPVRMIRAGLGDSLCRPTAQADWLLSHLLLGRHYREAPFMLLREDEPALLAQAANLVSGDRAAIALLARTLVLSGFGMAICGGSYPASQAEHLISHYVDMLGGNVLENFHGEQIGVTTLTVARLQHVLLEQATLRPRVTELSQKDFTSRLGPELAASCWPEFSRKAELHADLAAWPEIRGRIAAVMRPVGELARALQDAGAPRSHAELGWTDSLYRAALRNARLIRDRYTCLDLAADIGLLDEFDPAIA
jgi:glycerol-1-phosphate dehydrogenase [NAD(P)+]